MATIKKTERWSGGNPPDNVPMRSFEFTLFTPRYGQCALVHKECNDITMLDSGEFRLLFNNNMLTKDEVDYLWHKFKDEDYSYYKNDYGYEINT